VREVLKVAARPTDLTSPKESSGDLLVFLWGLELVAYDGGFAKEERCF